MVANLRAAGGGRTEAGAQPSQSLPCDRSSSVPLARPGTVATHTTTTHTTTSLARTHLRRLPLPLPAPVAIPASCPSTPYPPCSATARTHRALVSFSDGHMLFAQQGTVVWSRDEALATVSAVLFADLPAPASATGKGKDKGVPAPKVDLQTFIRCARVSLWVCMYTCVYVFVAEKAGG